MPKQIKERSSKNLKINTRIVWTSVIAIIVPLLIIGVFSPVFINTFATFFNISSVTSNEYSTINQMQWNQTISNINDELQSSDKKDTKIKRIAGFVKPLENYNTSIYISLNEKSFYATDSAEHVLEKAKAVSTDDTSKNFYYFGQNGLEIVDHISTKDGEYTIVIASTDYTVKNSNERYSAQSMRSVFIGRTGWLFAIIIALFIIAIVVTSFVTSKTIVNPIKKIAKASDEIAKGNLDYEIDYKSTNELGQMAESFNAMRLRLKETTESIEKNEHDRKEMTAGLAHDLRTPLTSIKGYVEGLIDGIANTAEKEQEYLKTIYDSTCQTEKMLNDLLTVSKLELGTEIMKKSIVSAKEFFADGAIEVEKMLVENNFSFEFLNNCSDDTKIEIDADSFERVFTNIVSNSIKYKRNGVDGIVRLFITEYEKNIIVEFEDNGMGVDRKNLGKIFNTLYRTDPARTEVSKGSGLGLSVCKQIVEQNNGSIWARSHEDSGLSIFISLPKKRDKE